MCDASPLGQLFICDVIMLSVLFLHSLPSTVQHTHIHTHFTPYTKYGKNVKLRGRHGPSGGWLKKDNRMTINVRKAIHLISSGHVAMRLDLCETTAMFELI